MQTWMMTIPMESECEVGTWMWLSWNPVTVVRRCTKKLLSYIFEQSDTKRYIVGIEKGHNGLDHFQIRLSCSDNLFFEHMKEWCEWAHVEKAESDSFEYERKEGRFWTSEDTVEVLKCRFGPLGGPGRQWQSQILDVLKRQDVRTIDVILDPIGCRGKSHFTIALWERSQALVVPRYSCTAEKLSAFVCSAYKGESIIIIDIPRANKPTTALYESMEEIKDGLVFDPRYSGRTRNVRGVKLLVFTNNPLDLKKLSHDRWNLHGITKDGTLS